MKISAAEQYAARFRRRAGTRWQQARHVSDMDQMLVNRHIVGAFPQLTQVRDVNHKRQPNHILRAVSIEDVFHPHKPTKKSDDKIKGARMVGDFKLCQHALVKWTAHLNEKGRHYFVPFAYPCMVDHGMQRRRGSRYGLDLVPVMGKKGEHQDSLGRSW